MTTPTPSGRSASHTACAIWSVIRSCTWSRRAKISTIRGSFERPRILPAGMYAMWTLPKKGSMWCSQSEYISMSFTSTMLWWSSSKIASPITSATLRPCPRVSHFRLFSTRSGVLRSPARSGSSPSCRNCSRMRSWKDTSMPPAGRSSRCSVPIPLMVSLPRVFDVVARRLPEHQAAELPLRDVGLQALPDRHHQVLRRGEDPLQPGNVQVEVEVIQVRDHRLLEDVAQCLQVDDVAGGRVHLPLHRHVELVVVPVPVRAVAEPEQLAVLRVGQGRVVQAVSGREVDSSCHAYLGHGPVPP